MTKMKNRSIIIVLLLLLCFIVIQHVLRHTYATNVIVPPCEKHIRRFFNEMQTVDVTSLMYTGDILLVHSAFTTGNVIRNITGAWYDHVAMILKNPEGQILQLFRCSVTQDKGLFVLESIYPRPRLIQLSKWLDEYSKSIVSWRKLLCVPEGGKVCNGCELIHQILLSDTLQTWRYAGLTQFLSGAYLERVNTRQLSSPVTCVQLILSLYTACGLIPDDASTRHWNPQSFSVIHDSDNVNKLLSYSKSQLLRDTILLNVTECV